MNKVINLKGIKISNNHPLVFMGGTCIIESEKHYAQAAKDIKKIVNAYSKNYVLKASFDKANRTSLKAFRGPGINDGLEILAKVKKDLNVPVIVDVHEPWQAETVAEVADILQIPAFLCRQTDLLLACGETGRVINVKKGQFLAPGGVENIIKKIESTGNKNIMLTERGFSFGYGDLVVDMRSLAIMKTFGYPVILDATHSVQKPGGLGNATGGDSKFAPILAKAATAIGIAGIFFEAHPNPECALSDGPNSLRYEELKKMISQTTQIDKLVKKFK
ncbi:2-Dehydro-3-deoxyphosphooctonate aldolase [Elusimicrobium minutum Pei191]|uniref:2-dehydro-3-deoxyphosphooctonate aldolase n=1 Tax=Elusimicrobium minutum (strain Pei191) TaxID=445932 RepID=B2KC21_ELUMP|nr:3-deoxy-8-phosphooctulonate synthase [Elusimicrobium minutum]ACC98148.1 2-Dehydro-3-deoxyphosphooctonate aldolase [Elusimicrobium minutum Pei191]